MIFTRGGRARDLQGRLNTWAPLIGEKATTTQARSTWWGKSGFLIGLAWVAANITLEATKHTGVPIAVVAIVAWPIILFCFVRAFRLTLRASRQAGALVGTSEKARPDVRSIQRFQRWSKASKYSRYKDGQRPYGG